MSAVARFPCKGNVWFTQEEDNVRVEVDLHHNIRDGLHGFHIHEYGDQNTQGCMDMGSHYGSGPHGSATSEKRHAGDMGNLCFLDGHARHTLLLQGERITNLGGRGLVVHERKDDLGNGSNTESLRTGNAGPRMLCAPIVLTSGEGR